MYKIFILFALLPHLFCAETPGRTSCSKYFKHTIDPETGKIFGRIEIRHFLLENEIYLKVALNATTLNGLFRLELARSIKETIRAIERGRPLLYHINFPSDANFLILSAIWFNKRRYCLGPRGSNGNIVANIELGHIVYPPNKLLPQDFQPWHRNSSGYRINNPNYKTHAECGVTNYYTEGTNSLIPNGATALPGQWPWVVALFRSVQTDLVTQRYFNCGGSLLTNKHVITAAHCLLWDYFGTTTYTPVNINMVDVVLGRFNLDELRGDGFAKRKIASYVIHPDYALYVNAGSDLAVLTLNNVVEFNPLIRPICLWSDSSKLEDVVSRTGYVVGWGGDEVDRDVADQRMVRANIVSHETCLSADAVYLSVISNNTFCADSRDGLGPCNGDGGNGLILLNNITDSYELRGVVSRTIIKQRSSCDLRKYIVYVDVAKYLPWIEQQISM